MRMQPAAMCCSYATLRTLKLQFPAAGCCSSSANNSSMNGTTMLNLSFVRVTCSTFPSPYSLGTTLARQFGKHAASFCALLADVVFLLFYACFDRVKSFVGYCLVYDSVHIYSYSALSSKEKALFCYQSKFFSLKSRYIGNL